MSTPKNIIVVDVESSCWEDKPPNLFPDIRNEIIEIGLSVIDIKEKVITQTRSIIVIPPTTELSDFCIQLTTITPELIAREGVPFADAIEILRNEYKLEKNIFASWGDYDRRSFEKNCKWNNVENPIKNLNLNVKALFAAKFGYTGGQVKCGEDLGIPFSGTQHRGVDDSFNVAQILLKLL